MSSIMKHPSFALRDVSEYEKAGKHMVKFTYDFNDKTLLIRSGWAVVSPSEKWVIRESENLLGPTTKRSLSINVQYEGEQDGFPVPKVVTVTNPACARSMNLTAFAPIQRQTMLLPSTITVCPS